MEEFKDRLKAAMYEKHFRAIDLAHESGITAQQISHYLKGSYKPKQDKLDTIAQCLGVSPAWLMCMTDTKEAERQQAERVNTYAAALAPFMLSEREKDLILAYRKLDRKTRGIVDYVVLGIEE